MSPNSQDLFFQGYTSKPYPCILKKKKKSSFVPEIKYYFPVFQTGRSRGFAFVYFKSSDDAYEVMVYFLMSTYMHTHTHTE